MIEVGDHDQIAPARKYALPHRQAHRPETHQAYILFHRKPWFILLARNARPPPGAGVGGGAICGVSVGRGITITKGVSVSTAGSVGSTGITGVVVGVAVIVGVAVSVLVG